MKKFLFSLLLVAACAGCGIAVASGIQGMTASQSATAEITFDTLSANLGTFPSSQPEQKCQFKFKNTGDADLIINQVFASCGCTVPSYPKDPIKPGASGVVTVTYNGANKFPGHFKKTITVRSNARNEIVRLSVEGTMTK